MIVRVHRQWQRAALLTAAGCALVAGSATAALASPYGPGRAPAQAQASAAGTIHACSAPAGQLRAIAAGQSCLSGETAMSWPGRATRATFYRVQPSALTVPPGTDAIGHADCNPGDQATGGGFTIVNTSLVTVEESSSEGTPPSGWYVVVFNNDTVAHNFDVEAECVHLP